MSGPLFTLLFYYIHLTEIMFMFCHVLLFRIHNFSVLFCLLYQFDSFCNVYQFIVVVYILNTEYYMSKSVSHVVSIREPCITPRATGPRCDIDRGLIRHVIQILTCNVHYIIYFNHAFDNTCILWKFWIFLRTWIFLNFEHFLKFFFFLWNYENFEILKFFEYTI